MVVRCQFDVNGICKGLKVVFSNLHLGLPFNLSPMPQPYTVLCIFLYSYVAQVEMHIKTKIG